MDDKLLSALGLKGKEMQIYRIALQLGACTPVALAKEAGVKRTTAYSIARSLVDKGFLREDATKRPRSFVAASADEVLGIIDIERQKLLEKETAVRHFSIELSKMQAQQTYPVPTVRFVESDKLEPFLRSQASVWHKSLEKTGSEWLGFQDHTFVEQFSEWITWYWQQPWSPIELKLLSNRSESELAFGSTIGQKRQVKFWGEATNFHSTTWVVGEYVIMVNTRQRPFYLVEIHDALMAHDHREVYRNLWPLV